MDTWFGTLCQWLDWCLKQRQHVFFECVGSESPSQHKCFDYIIVTNTKIWEVVQYFCCNIVRWLPTVDTITKEHVARKGLADGPTSEGYYNRFPAASRCFSKLIWLQEKNVIKELFWKKAAMKLCGEIWWQWRILIVLIALPDRQSFNLVLTVW